MAKNNRTLLPWALEEPWSNTQVATDGVSSVLYKFLLMHSRFGISDLLLSILEYFLKKKKNS